MAEPTLCAVPPALVFRKWAADESGVAPRRRLMLENDSPAAIPFRVTPPAHSAFALGGAGAAVAAAGETAVLDSGATMSFTVEIATHLLADAGPEVCDEILVRYPGGVLHIPLIALATADKPDFGDPTEARSAPLADEPAWPAMAPPDADSDEELWAASGGAAPRKGSRGGAGNQ